MIKMILAKVKAFFTYDPVEAYLAKANDHADLERRLKEVEYGRFDANKFI
jgi:hypothetical protein